MLNPIQEWLLQNQYVIRMIKRFLRRIDFLFTAHPLSIFRRFTERSTYEGYWKMPRCEHAGIVGRRICSRAIVNFCILPEVSYPVSTVFIYVPQAEKYLCHLPNATLNPSARITSSQIDRSSRVATKATRKCLPLGRVESTNSRRAQFSNSQYQWAELDRKSVV